MLTRAQFVDNLINTPRSSSKFSHWKIIANGEPLNITFKKTISNLGNITERAADKEFTLLKDDLIHALKLYDMHVETKGKTDFEATLRYVLYDGTIIYKQCKAGVTTWSDQGLPLSMEGSHMDITEHKSAYIKDEEQHKLIVEGINAGLWDLDVKTGKMWCSDKTYELLGYTRGELTADYHTFLFDLLHPDDLKRTTEMITGLFKTSAPYINDIRLKHKDGNYHWFETCGKAKLNRKGRPIRIVGSLINKDHRKRLLAELERYQFLIDESSALINAGSWEINFINDTLTWFAGMHAIHETTEEFRPLIRNLFQFLQERDRIYFKQLLKDAYHKGLPYDAAFESVTAKGNLKWIRMIGKPVINDNGTITTIRGITQDIHEQKMKDEQIKNSFDLITSKNESLSNFAHIVSHNLRSHAGNMESILKLLEITPDHNEQKELFVYLKKISANLNQTIEQLSETVQAQNISGIPRTNIQISNAINNVLDVLRATINETNAIIIYDTSEYSEIEYVAAYLESIILNLISNAIKYRKPNTQPIIEIKAFLENGKKCLSVQDNGQGIDLAKHGHNIFGMYKTFHSNPDAVGIGLFITKTQIESLGGKITVESDLGKGTRFTIKF